MGKCSWISVMAQLSFHQHHTDFRCEAKFHDFLLEMQIRKLSKKAFTSLIRQSFLPNSFLITFLSSALFFLIFFFFHAANPCSLYQTQVKYHFLSEPFPDKTLMGAS